MKTIIIGILVFINAWDNSIYNTKNEEFIVEVAFNLEISVDEVTQEQFNDRYINQ
jgi:hypothetical protein|tara:strand:- start:830 stop:994 length:165 start_codon:yes stop_codon:yes gene_type:complete